MWAKKSWTEFSPPSAWASRAKGATFGSLERGSMRFSSGLGLFLLGYSLLVYEMALTRVCSALFAYHFSFLAVSMALVGLGCGGLVPGRRRHGVDRYFVGFSLGIVFFTLVSFLVPLHQVNWYQALFGLTCIGSFPFVCCGAIICDFLERYRSEAGKVYAYDLCGGALACLTVNQSLNWIGPVYTMLLAAFWGALAGILTLGARRGLNRWVAPLILALGAVQVSTNFIRMATFNDQGVARPVFLETWNCLSRISVLFGKNERGTYPRFCIDTGADTWASPPNAPIYNPSDVAYAMRPQGRYAVIGPGAGSDVQLSIPYKPTSIDLVEINPIMIDLVQRNFDSFTGGLYRRPEVSIHIGDGRSYMDRTRQQFDVLVISLVDTYASVSGGAYALTENFLYTTEAISSYLARVSPGGILCVSRWPIETPRLLALVRKAFERRGVSNCLDRVFLLMSRDNRMMTVLIKPEPWTPEELQKLHQLAAAHTLNVGLSPTSDPTREALAAVLVGGDLQQLNRNSHLELSPVTDDQPFFLFFWKPKEAYQPDSQGKLSLPWRPGLTLQDLGAEEVEGFRSTVTILMVPIGIGLVCSTLVSLAYVGRYRSPRSWVIPCYFALLGLGFMLFEISLSQRVVLLMGHPAHAISVVLFTFLVCGATGSWLSQKVSEPGLRKAQTVASLGVAVAAVFASQAYPPYLGHFLSSSFLVRTLACFLWMAPLGILAGMLFPMGLRRIGESEVPWTWALNGGASVAGSASAVALGLYWGFDITTNVGALCYLLVAGLAGMFPTREPA